MTPLHLRILPVVNCWPRLAPWSRLYIHIHAKGHNHTITSRHTSTGYVMQTACKVCRLLSLYTTYENQYDITIGCCHRSRNNGQDQSLDFREPHFMATKVCQGVLLVI